MIYKHATAETTIDSRTAFIFDHRKFIVFQFLHRDTARGGTLVDRSYACAHTYTHLFT